MTELINLFNLAYEQALQTQTLIAAITDRIFQANMTVDACDRLQQLAIQINDAIKNAKDAGQDTTEFQRKYDEIIEIRNNMIDKYLLFRRKST